MENVNISIIDSLGQMGDGVGLLLSLVIGDDAYELSYWFNENGIVRLVADDKLLAKLNISNIYEYSRIQEFLDFIYVSLPDPKQILSDTIKK